MSVKFDDEKLGTDHWADLAYLKANCATKADFARLAQLLPPLLKLLLPG